MTRPISVDPARLERWLAGFTERHGPVDFVVEGDTARVSATDGALAQIRIPFPPLPGSEPADLLAHIARDRRVGALLARRGGVAVGVFDGRRLAVSKIETSYVQGRTKAGGWSQQRYARRRDNQARKLTETAADLVASLVLPRIETIDAVVTGGDRWLVDAVFADSRLAAVRAKALDRVHPVPDPRLSVLQRFPDQFLAVEIELNELA
jgi:hypothetical protein